jgi:ABC-2 type transport system permease protein
VGVAGVFFGGYRDMAATILRGELDALLTQPKPLIRRLMARESSATAWGELAGGAFILVGFARLEAGDLPLVVVALACGLTVYVSAATAFATLAFWAAGARSFSRELTDFMLLFSTYPASIFQGATKIIAFTVLPAGFVVMVPVRLLREPGLATLATAVAAAAGYAVLAVALFNLGLARYRRGASPGMG